MMAYYSHLHVNVVPPTPSSESVDDVCTIKRYKCSLPGNQQGSKHGVATDHRQRHMISCTLQYILVE